MPSPGREHILETERVLPFPPAALYAALADPARLAQWWGPEGFTNTFHRFEFVPDGQWAFTMHGPDGRDYANECVFAELAASEKAVIRHVSAPHFTLTITLSPCNTGTHIHWEQAFDDPAVANAVRHIAEPGNEQNLDRLHRHLAVQ